MNDTISINNKSVLLICIYSYLHNNKYNMYAYIHACLSLSHPYNNKPHILPQGQI